MTNRPLETRADSFLSELCTGVDRGYRIETVRIAGSAFWFLFVTVHPMITSEGAPTLPRIDWDAITFVQFYYDGPLTGLCTFSDRVHYFEVDPESEYGERLYVYELTDEEIAVELEMRRIFEKHIGTHWSYDLHQSEQEVRRPIDSEGYDAAVAAAFPDAPSDDEKAPYSDRPPVAVISSYPE